MLAEILINLTSTDNPEMLGFVVLILFLLLVFSGIMNYHWITSNEKLKAKLKRGSYVKKI